MSVKPLGYERAIVVSGPDVAAVAWALSGMRQDNKAVSGCEEVLILDRGVAYLAMTVMDELRGVEARWQRVQLPLTPEIVLGASDALYEGLRQADTVAATASRQRVAECT